jgi:uncharacterized membrane protein
MNSSEKKGTNIFLRMHPLQRILISLTVTAIAFLLSRYNTWNWKITATLLWDVFAFTFLITSWIVFFTRPIAGIVKQANKEDGSKIFVMGSILITSFASMLTVLLLVIAKTNDENEVLVVVLSVAGMLVSWAMVHTIFTFHYAHLYYLKKKDDTPDTEALDFPNEKKPDYLDFAYFSFVIGMTFQVSDVEISSRKIRRTVLAHGLLSFVLNTFVVALTINMVAGLKK